jgi:hypothetical protein
MILKENNLQFGEALKELGFEEGTFAFSRLSFLIKSVSDFVAFVSEFYDRNKTQLEDVVQFRHWKIDQLDLSFEEFEALYQESKKKALETLFQEPMSEKDFGIVVNNIVNKLYTLRQLFDYVKEYHVTSSSVRYALPDCKEVVDLGILRVVK